ncbi:MAG: nicotinate phosphoribosyltransferase [Myxococcaceae bacterium]
MTSLLLTDGYKFSMAEAGWPLRRETFYASHRKGGLQVVPFDAKAELEALLPVAAPGDFEYLAAHDYDLGSAVRAALTDRSLTITALPQFSVFVDREPIVSVTGPSSLVSWLEPLVLQWSYRVQVATLALKDEAALANEVKTVTCARQKELVLQTLDAIGVKAPPITVDEAGYFARVKARVAELVEIVGSPGRIFEVGLRAATCPEQHLLALEAAKSAGLLRTSNVHGAKQLGLTPVGTMGHEHIQRYGSDEAAFRAMVERRHQRSSFLLDTFDTIGSGIPTAFRIIAERPGLKDSIRYDSGDKVAQYRFAAAEAKRLGIRPVQILEDGFDFAQTRQFEALRAEVGLAPEEQVYGYGGFIVAQTSGSTLTRDRVAAVYKLSQTGSRPTMKFGNEGGGGKQSIPGRPVVFRRRAGASGPFGVVGQEGEAPPQGYDLLSGAPASSRVVWPEVAEADRRIEPSTATRALIAELSQWKHQSG